MTKTARFWLASLLALAAVIRCSGDEPQPTTSGCPGGQNRPSTGERCNDTSVVCSFTAAGNTETCSCVTGSTENVWVCSSTPAAAT